MVELWRWNLVYLVVWQIIPVRSFSFYHFTFDCVLWLGTKSNIRSVLIGCQSKLGEKIQHFWPHPLPTFSNLLREGATSNLHGLQLFFFFSLWEGGGVIFQIILLINTPSWKCSLWASHQECSAGTVGSPFKA